jgi:hypothetical protein
MKLIIALAAVCLATGLTASTQAYAQKDQRVSRSATARPPVLEAR